MSGFKNYQALSVALLILLIAAGVPAVLLGSSAVGAAAGDWAVVAAIATFLVLTGILMELGSRLLRWGRQASYKQRFTGYGGTRIPVFNLLEGPASWKQLQSDGTMFWLGDAEECFFLIRTNVPNKRGEITGERLPDSDGLAFTIPKAEIQAVEVIGRTDEDIESSAVDRRDYGDRLASAIAQRVTGMRIGTRIVPYAAYVSLRSSSFELLFGVPTEVHPTLMRALKANTSNDPVASDGLIQGGARIAGAQAAESLKQAARSEFSANALDAVDTVTGIAREASWVLRPDRAQIGSAEGARGRSAATLIAEHILTRSGPPGRPETLQRERI